jgi:sulfur transfer protein SufE
MEINYVDGRFTFRVEAESLIYGGLAAVLMSLIIGFTTYNICSLNHSSSPTSPGTTWKIEQAR